MPCLSVVVPSYNSLASIEKSLRAIRSSIYKDYELIVVDDGSSDGSAAIARQYANRLIEFKINSGRNHARREGFAVARGEIIVNIDSDVLIGTDTLGKIADYFRAHPKTDAVTGLLSKEHLGKDFFSQYKNLYMHYTFKRLPERVNFLYGSICAMRKEIAQLCDADIAYGVDTAYGQELISCGKRIVFLKDLEVTHLKKYNLISFIRNDFKVPYCWAKIFIHYKGWKQLGRNNAGFAHAPLGQLISVLLVLPIFILAFIPNKSPVLIMMFLSFCIFWLALNLRFLRYFLKERGFLFMSASILATFIDHIVMASGIACGLLHSAIRKNSFKINADFN